MKYTGVWYDRPDERCRYNLVNKIGKEQTSDIANALLSYLTTQNPSGDYRMDRTSWTNDLANREELLISRRGPDFLRRMFPKEVACIDHVTTFGGQYAEFRVYENSTLLKREATRLFKELSSA